MRIWLVGGGTAGHALPLTALASELEDRAELIIITDRNPAAAAALAGSKWPIKRIFSGKFRRYHGRTWRSRLIDVGTLLRNLADLAALAAGLVQAAGLMLWRRPDVVFINGGSIGVPVAWAARLFGRPYLIHESDTKPGLANRMIAAKAKRVLIGLAGAGLPDDGRHFVTGIPLRANFRSAKQGGARSAKARLKLPVGLPLILVTGGSQGAQTLNRAVAAIVSDLTKEAYVVHLAGEGNIKGQPPKRPAAARYRLIGFAGQEMADYLAAADIVVARAGASTLADLAYFAKPAVLIPNPLLVGGHQLANAAAFAGAGAAVVLDEKDVAARPQRLLAALRRLLADAGERKRLSAAMAALKRPGATADIARHILEVGRGE